MPAIPEMALTLPNDTEDAHFHHPYKPYGIQTDFMKTLYETLESKKVGIFESPTGESLPIDLDLC